MWRVRTWGDIVRWYKTVAVCVMAGLAAGIAQTAAASGPPSAPYATFLTPDHNWVDALAYSPDGKTVAVASINELFSSTGVTYKGGHTYLWNVTSGAVTRRVFTTLSDPGGKGVVHVVFSPDGKYLAVGDANTTTYVWNVSRRTLVASVSDPGTDGVAGIAFGPDDTLLTADSNGAAFQWDIPAAGSAAVLTTPAATFAGPGGQGLFSIAVSPNRQTMALGSSNGHTYLWDIGTQTMTASLADPASKGVIALAFGGHDGSLLAAGDNNGQTYVWNVATLRLAGPLRAPGVPQSVKAVAFSPAGTILVTGDAYGHVYVWNAAARTQLASLQYPGERSVFDIAFNPSGTTIAVGDTNSRASLWNASWLRR
jgi:WD40 repeat protein